MIVILNSVISKAMVTNHSQPRGSRRCLISLKVDLSIPPEQVIKALTTAAASPPNPVHGAVAMAFARSFSDKFVEYQLAFLIDNFALTPSIKSEMIIRIAESFRRLDIPMGTAALQVRLGKADSATHIDRPAADPMPPIQPEPEITA
jgi:small-conductance mechanosensitive channel